MQPQGHVQVLLNILRGFTAQAALDAPRFCISAGSPETQGSDTGSAGDINSEVYFEEGISEDVVKKLRGKFGARHDSESSKKRADDFSSQNWVTTLASRLGMVVRCSAGVK